MRQIVATIFVVSICLLFLNMNRYTLNMNKHELRNYGCEHLADILQSEVEKLVQNGKQSNQLQFYHDGGMMNDTAPTSFITSNETVMNRNKDPFLIFTAAQPQFVLGSGPSGKVKFSVGIPTVRRPSGISYLYRTLITLFRNLLPVNEKDITVTLFIADDNLTYVKELMMEVQHNFTREIEVGLLQVISRPYDFQPPENISSYFPENDEQRLRWRSNEVFDAAFLMYYSRDKADYYLMLEDDVESAKSYLQDIKEFLETHSSFIFASLAQFGSIGKLFPAHTLPKWATYLYTFYAEKPIDWLMADYINLLSCHPMMSAENCKKAVAGNNPRINAKRGLFQHIGLQSSLEGKIQKIVDRGFRTTPGSNPHHNPVPLYVKSSFTSDADKDPLSVYSDSGGLKESFMAIDPRVGERLSVRFSQPYKVNRILVRTGDLQDRYKMSENCGFIETEYLKNDSLTLNSAENSTLCTFFDRNGLADCIPTNDITGFHIGIAQHVPNNVWFNAIYVETET